MFLLVLVEKLGSDLVTFPSYIPLWDPQIRFALSSKIQIVRSGMPCTTKGGHGNVFFAIHWNKEEKENNCEVVCFCPWTVSKRRRGNEKKRKTFPKEVCVCPWKVLKRKRGQEKKTLRKEVCVCPSSTPSLCPSPSLTRGAERGVHAALQFSPTISYNTLD